MQDLVRETVFGRFVHLASRGKLFAPAEQRDPSKVQRYFLAKSGSSSGTSLNALEGDKIDREKGSDYELIDWGENDSEV
jgi:hypothetical protein